MAIHVVAGEPLNSFVVYRYPDETPIEGATFAVVSALRPDGSSFADTVTVAEQGSGVYHVTAPTTATAPAGEWFLLVEGDADGSQFKELFDVTNTRTPIHVVQNIYRGGTSRQEIRRMVAAELGDLFLVTATADGTQSSIVDEINLSNETRYYNGMHVRCTSGPAANVGQFATVSISNQDTRSVTFFPPLPIDTQVGDEFELTNLRGTGWRGDEYDRAINAAIRKAGDEHYTLPYSVKLTEPYTYDSELTIPDEFTYFSGVGYAGRRGPEKLRPSEFEVDRFTRTVNVRRKVGRRMIGRTVTMYGEIEPPLLEMDDHRTPIPVEWLMVEVKAILQNKSVSTAINQSNRDRLYFMDRQGADARRMLIIPSRAPNTIKIGRGSGAGSTYAGVYGAVYAEED